MRAIVGSSMLVSAAINERAVTFYEGNGFVRLPDCFRLVRSNDWWSNDRQAPKSTDTNAARAAKVALYLRVSTGRQAESDLSIPDQRRQIVNYCTATDDRRPALQAMIDAAPVKPPTFTMIIVHSFSPFLRDQFQFEFYVRKLAKNGVRLISITQDLGDDPMSVMMRQIMTLFDEYQSKENGKRAVRAMKGNSRQGL